MPYYRGDRLTNNYHSLKLKERIKRIFKIKSLKTRIIILILAATIPMILSSIISLLSNDIYMARYFSMHEKLSTVDEVLTDCVNILPIIREYISDPLLDENRMMYDQLKKDIEEKQQKLDALTDKKYEYFANDVSLYLKFCDDTKRMAENYDPGVRSSYTKIELQMDNVKKSAIDLTMQELNKGNQTRDYISKKILSLNIGILVINVILIIVITLMIYFVLKRVTSNLGKLENMSFQVTQGNYDIPFINVSGEDEISLLSKAFNDMIHSLKAGYIEIDNRQVELEKLNRDLIETNRQLKSTNEDLKNAQEQIIQSEKLASLGELVAGVSHEINTPIGICVSAASYLDEKNKELIEKFNANLLSKKDFKHYIETVEETSKILMSNLGRAADLIGSFKKIAVDQTSEESREINVIDYIKDVITSLKHILKRTSIDIIVESESDEIVIKTYPGPLAQVITNLIMNSVIHGFEQNEKGLIHIKADKDNEDMFILHFCDNGKGMSEEVQKRIFEPFFTTKRGQGGSGLGMFIVYNIVTKYFGGNIECTSSEGNGVSFTIKLPAINKE